MKIEIFKATIEQKQILANLLELYTYEFTDFFAFDIGSDGYYGYEYLPLYWTDPNRYPYLIYVEEKLAGFVLIQKGSPISDDKNIFDVAEFFIMKKYRRKNIGSTVVMDIWRQFIGRWQVRVLLGNKEASLFWTSVIAQFVKKDIVPFEIENRWLVYQFISHSKVTNQLAANHED
jgi:predicted acetyltransferase